MNELSLFTGAGGGVLGSKILGWETVGYVEWDEYCQKVIAQRIRDGIFDEAPIFGDIRAFIDQGYAARYRGMVDIVSGGFPCQDISIGNANGDGIDGERSGLWKEMADIICLVGPRFVLVENSPMLTSRGLGTVLRDLAGMGFNGRWGMFRASDFGANHFRKRIWIFAYAVGIRRHSLDQDKEIVCSVVHSKGPPWRSLGSFDIPISMDGIINNPGLGVCRNDDGLAEWLGPLKAIGNGQVPLCMAYAYEILSRGIVGV